jgi:hypothetical protein
MSCSPFGDRAGQRAGGARLAGPDLDPAVDQDVDRAAVPQELHHPGGLSHPSGHRRLIALDRPAGGHLTRPAVPLEQWPQVEEPRRRPRRGSSSTTRRGRVLDDAAVHPDLDPARGHPDRASARLLPAPIIGGRPGLPQPDRPPHLIYRPCADARMPAPTGARSFAWTDYRDLIAAAHHQLGDPPVLVWDNLNTHLTAGMRRYIVTHRLPAPQLRPRPQPVEGTWPVPRRTRQRATGQGRPYLGPGPGSV